MNKKLLLKLGIPFVALTIIAGCGTDDGNDPVDEEAPLMEDDDGAPLNPDEDNGDMNGDNGQDDGGDEQDGGEMTDDPEQDDLEEEFDNQDGTGGTGNQ
jgi:penicillin-binding protein 1A